MDSRSPSVSSLLFILFYFQKKKKIRLSGGDNHNVTEGDFYLSNPKVTSTHPVKVK